MSENIKGKWRESYTPFGETTIDHPDNDNHTGFTGHIKDKATGLNYMQARYYDPNIGRFLSIDPMTFMETGEPGMFNRYAYTMKDPVNLIDPFGMSPKSRSICDTPGSNCGASGLRGFGKSPKVEAAKGVWNEFVSTAQATQSLTVQGLVSSALGVETDFSDYMLDVDPLAQFGVTVASFIGPSSKIKGTATLATHSHHIIAKSAKAAAPARDHAIKFGLDVKNGVFNRVNLPSTIHSPLHRNSYYREINKRILRRTTARGVCEECAMIGRELRQIRSVEEINRIFPLAK